MKNQDNKKVVLAISTEYAINKKETVSTMETVLFTNISEKELINTSFLKWYDLLDFIAFENNLKCKFAKFGLYGKDADIEKAQTILVNNIKYN